VQGRNYNIIGADSGVTGLSGCHIQSVTNSVKISRFQLAKHTNGVPTLIPKIML
jgi:hypothetical protein